jgi:hypothetical protein
VTVGTKYIFLDQSHMQVSRLPCQICFVCNKNNTLKNTIHGFELHGSVRILVYVFATKSNTLKKHYMGFKVKLHSSVRVVVYVFASAQE